jgi:triphosphatase
MVNLPGGPPGSTPPSREVELKLDGGTAELQSLALNPAIRKLAEGEAVSSQLVTVYYDTAELTLANRGIALRLRQDGGQTIQGIKTFGSTKGDRAGLAVRHEWEWLLTQADLDLTILRDPALGEIVPPDLIDRLVPVMVTDIHRTILNLVPNQGTRIEMAIDRGSIRVLSGTERAPPLAVNEVELELKAGRAADLYTVARRLHAIHPLRISVHSKADRGFAQLQGGAIPSSTERPTGLTPATSQGEAFRHCIRSGLAQLLEQDARLLEGRQPSAMVESLAALHRLDAAFRLFKQLTDGPVFNQLIEILRRHIDQLGLAVAIQAQVERIIDLKASAGIRREAMTHAVIERCAQAHSAARQRVRNPDWMEWILDLAIATESGDWLGNPATSVPMTELAPGLLNVRLVKARRAADNLFNSDRSSIARFSSRISRLRTYVEFLRGLFPRDGVRPVHAALIELEQTLQAAVTARNARTLLLNLYGKGQRSQPVADMLRVESNVLRQSVPRLWLAVTDSWVWETDVSV